MANAKKSLPAASPQQEPDRGFTGDEYNAVAMGSKLDEIKLMTVKFDAKPDLLSLAPGDLQLSYSRDVVACQVIPEASQVAAIFAYSVIGRAKRKKVLSCLAEYFVVYDIPANSPEPAAAGFCRNIGSFAAYPYFRSLVAQLTWAHGLQLPPLPAIASTAHIPKKLATAENAKGTQEELAE